MLRAGCRARGFKIYPVSRWADLPLTGGPKAVRLFPSMWARDEVASQRRAGPCTPWLRNARSCAIVGRCAGCILPTFTRT